VFSTNGKNGKGNMESCAIFFYKNGLKGKEKRSQKPSYKIKKAYKHGKTAITTTSLYLKIQNMLARHIMQSIHPITCNEAPGANCPTRH